MINNLPNNSEQENKKKKSLTAWWNRLSKGAKVGISATGAVALSSVIIFPILATTIWNKGGDTPKVKELTKIDVSTNPSLHTYEVGDKFDAINLKVKAHWSDGTIGDVESTEYKVSPEIPYTFKTDDVANGKDFTVTYLTKNQTVHVDVKNRTIEATWTGDKYLSKDAGSVSSGTIFNGSVIYSEDDVGGFNGIKMTRVSESKHDLKINDGTASINVTQVKKANGDDITSSCSVADYVLYTPSSSFLKENLYITFTVTKPIETLFLIAHDYI